jgi:hypothetical protein
MADSDKKGGGLVPYRQPPEVAFGRRLKVRISSSYLRYVAFLFEDRDEGLERRRMPVATSFFVRVAQPDDPAWGCVYLVTARHVIEQSTRDTIWVRVNKSGQAGYEDFPTSRDDWRVHGAADVAAIPSPVSAPSHDSQMDHWPIELSGLVGPGPDYEYCKEPVSLGDELFGLGLFIQDCGRERNLPVARFGHIARMPDKVDISIDTYGNTLEIVAYVAEFLSWGGESGSPVFWIHPVGGEVMPRRRSVTNALLGLVSAHFFIPKKADVTGDVLGTVRTGLNSGLAIITPAEAIRQLLMREDFVRERDRLYAEERRRRVADSVELD